MHFLNTIYAWLPIVRFYSGIISLILFFLVVMLRQKMIRILNEERIKYAPIIPTVEPDQTENKNWQAVLNYLASANPSDWKLAILEADNMLDKMMEQIGYRGENLGERLKAVEASDFLTLNDAWEAHKIRNQIAHQSGFVLTHREVRRTIDLYEKVFNEFSYI